MRPQLSRINGSITGGRHVGNQPLLTTLILARNHRSQERNRREAEERLVDLVRRALAAPKARRPTKPTRAAREQRLEQKARQRSTKRLRRVDRP